MSAPDRRAKLDRSHPDLSVRRQCEMLHVARSGVYRARNQPDSALSVWYREKVRDGRGRIKRIAIIALARKLLVALWRFVAQGVVPSGAVLKLAKPA